MIDFIGVGPLRTATSWLDAVLRRHPSVCLPRSVKETMYFSRYYDRPVSWYLSHFQHCKSGMRVGEIGPSYFDFHEAPQRISSLASDCKILVSLRDPISRTMSLYHHELTKGRVRGSLRDAVAQMPRLVTSSHYRQHLPRWIETFGRERVLVLFTDDIERDPASVVEQVQDFLEVSRMRPPEEVYRRIGVATTPRFPSIARAAARVVSGLRARRLHSFVELGKRLGLKRVYGSPSDHPPLEPGDREWLQDMFSRDVRYVEQIVGRDLPHWN